MKKYIYIIASFCLVMSLAFTGCEDDIEYVESAKPQSIKILDITDNSIAVHTTETFQVSMGVVPENAEMETPITYTYESGDKEVFTVSATGLITGTGVGEAPLYVTTPEYPDLKTTAIVTVTDRYFNITSIEVDEQFRNYTMAPNSTLDLSPYVTVKPDNATNPAVTYESSNPEVASVTENGFIEAKQAGTATIRIKPVDNSPVTGECIITVKETVYTDLDRTNWVITPSHQLPPDDAIKNSPESLIDGLLNTCLSMVKPDKNYAGISVPKTDEVYFVIDMQSEQEMEYMKIGHRSTNTQTYLRPYAMTISGSNDGTTFTPIIENAKGQPEEAEYTIHFPLKAKYRYVKVLYTEWDEKSGSTIQIAELNIGKMAFE